MARPHLKLYVDTVSPFAYMAFYVIKGDLTFLTLKNSPIFKGCDVTYVPVFLGGIMKACGNIPPIRIKNKDVWIDKERLHWAGLFSIPMNAKTPPGFPVMTLPVSRALCAVDPEQLSDVLENLYEALWVNHTPIQNPEETTKILEGVLGKAEADSVMEKSTSPEIKQQLTENTEQAMADGAFGLPWFVATNVNGETQTYWGFDHFGQVIDHLGLERPHEQRGWRALL